ncbi:hypothetical protein [Novipirellula sp.]|uniref:hypothetical protein n=1 Tax=Novipirellula sp. TaxID=2795430 RepID=UPI0035612E53
MSAKEQERYVPLSERLNQDVWHDNFVPKYSALASAKPSLLILTGVWLIFAPMALMSAATLIGTVFAFLSGEAANQAAPVLVLLGSLLWLLLVIAILTKQTRRYWLAKRPLETEMTETE